MANITFSNPLGGTWNTLANWDTSLLPDGNALVTFISGTYTSVVDGGPWVIQSLNVNVSTVTLRIDVDLTAQTLEGNLGAIVVEAGATFTLGSLNSSSGSITVGDGGVLTVQNLNGHNSTIVAAANGLVNLEGNGAGSFTVSGGLLKIAGNFNGTGTIQMNAGTMWLAGNLGASSYNLDDGAADQMFFDTLTSNTSNTFTGADAGDRLAIKGVTINAAHYSGTTLTLDTSGGAFSFNKITIAPGSVPNATLGTTTFEGNDYGFIELGLACFAEGTRIDTPTGPIAVEALREGMLVTTTEGGSRPVRWIGWRRLDFRRHPNPASAQPIRVLADAFAPGMPRRDLLLSPSHAVFAEGMLIPVEFLVNGATISREESCRMVTYYHVELESHDILLAEGLAAESYLDTGNRGIFENAGLPLTLHPDLSEPDGHARRAAESCAPFTTDADLVWPIWKQLSDRAVALGLALPEVATTADPDLWVEFQGRRLQPASVQPGRYVFVLPVTDESVRLISNATAPNELRPWVQDRRRLGVEVRRLTLRRNGDQETLSLDDPNMSRGWWAAENDGLNQWRWTSGVAELPLMAGGPAVLEIEFGAMPAYRIAASAAAGPSHSWDAEMVVSSAAEMRNVA